MALIETVNLCQRYGERDILKNVNLRIDRGEVFALIGPTGAGKTTLLRLIDLIDEPASGKIFFDGVDAAAPAAVRLGMRRCMAFVLQKPVVFNVSVHDNIACALRWRGVRGSKLKEKVNHITDVVGLSDYGNRNARQLSGGEVQRVAIARAMAIEPEVLLLDEPMANLDPLSAARIEELISSIIRRYATTIIMATHDLSQGQRLADRMAVMMGGELLQTGSSKDVFTSPRNREVAEFVGVENIIDGVIASSEDNMVTLESRGRSIEAISDYQVGAEVCACIRPEDITLALSRISSSARNSFEGEITWLVNMGPLTRVEVQCGFPLVAMVTKRSAEEMGLTKGKKIYATFKATGVHVIKRN
ncbi:MAG: ATP-binding cassette domain-containing protein [Dehalococcoidia bacterium]|nr:ATP-binding cassette domain-containing protein [Dehalococcoidia bacterium]